MISSIGTANIYGNSNKRDNTPRKIAKVGPQMAQAASKLRYDIIETYDIIKKIFHSPKQIDSGFSVCRRLTLVGTTRK